MVFVRMLPAAWLASLYAACLLVLLILLLNPGLAIRPATVVSFIPLVLLLSLPTAVGWPAGYRFVRLFARRRLRVRWFSFKYLLGFACANLLLVSSLYWYNVNLLQALVPEAQALTLRISSGLVSLVSLGFLAIGLVKRWRSLMGVRMTCYLVAGMLPLGLGLMGGGYSQATPPAYTPQLVAPSADAPRLLLLGIEGATLDQVLPLVAQGKLPWFGKLLQKGVHGRLASFRPGVSVVAWESLFTGKLPSRHGVLDDTRYELPFGAGEIRVAPRGFLFRCFAKRAGMSSAPQQPSESTALTLVQILDRLGYPARILRGGERGEGSSWHRAKVGLDRLLDPEIPTPPDTRELKNVLLRALEEDEAAATAALEAWREGRVRAVFLQLPGLDRVSHRFLRYAMPASFGDVPPEEQEKYGTVLERYYRFLDDWLGKFLGPEFREGQASGDSPLVLVVSPHGIEPLALVPRLLLRLAGDRFESGQHDRAPDGMIVAAGPGVAHGRPLGKASILDVTPTLLYSLRLPIGMDMDGHPLARLFDDAFIAERPVLLIPSYEGSRIAGRETAASGFPLTGADTMVR